MMHITFLNVGLRIIILGRCNMLMRNIICFQRAFRYLQQAADAGNSNAMAYLGKVCHYVAVFSSTFLYYVELFVQ